MEDFSSWRIMNILFARNRPYSRENNKNKIKSKIRMTNMLSNKLRPTINARV